MTLEVEFKRWTAWRLADAGPWFPSKDDHGRASNDPIMRNLLTYF
jgi:hypothetical protein